jgi:hypothetical protein
MYLLHATNIKYLKKILTDGEILPNSVTHNIEIGDGAYKDNMNDFVYFSVVKNIPSYDAYCGQVYLFLTPYILYETVYYVSPAKYTSDPESTLKYDINSDYENILQQFFTNAKCYNSQIAIRHSVNLKNALIGIQFNDSDKLIGNNVDYIINSYPGVTIHIYNFAYFETKIQVNVWQLHDFITSDTFDKYKEQMTNLINICFRIKFDQNELKNYILSQDTIFLAINPHNEDELLGIACINNETVKYSKKRIDTYTLKKNDLNFNEISEVNLYPMINTFCRDPNPMHKGTGTELIKEITNYYKKNNFKYIYAVPESRNDFKSEKTNDIHCGLLKYGYNNAKSKYYTDTLKLIKYYKSVGFEILENHYLIRMCNNNNDYTAFNIVHKNL